jgi:hypothetical protein
VHAQRVALAIAAAVGMICTFLPWVNVPLIGAIYGTRGDGWITLALCAGALACALTGDRRAGLSLGPHITSALIGVVTCLVALWKILEFNEAIPDDEFGAAFSVGAGLYLLVAAGGAIALLPALSNGSPAPQPPAWSPAPPQAWSTAQPRPPQWQRPNG